MKTKIMKRLAVLALALVTVLSVTACGGGSGGSGGGASAPGSGGGTSAPENTGEKYTSRIGHSDTTANLIHISLEHFAEAVKERTNGQVEVQIFAAEQLGSNAEMIEMVEMGSLDAMMLPSGQQAN